VGQEVKTVRVKTEIKSRDGFKLGDMITPREEQPKYLPYFRTIQTWNPGPVKFDMGRVYKISSFPAGWVGFCQLQGQGLTCFPLGCFRKATLREMILNRLCGKI